MASLDGVSLVPLLFEVETHFSQKFYLLMSLKTPLV